MNTKVFGKGLSAIVVLLFAYLQGFSQQKETQVSYTNFTVNSLHKKVLLNWQIAKDSQANYFEIQRSLDGKNFKTVELVLGPDPQKTDCDCYEGFDFPTSKSQKYYYRLKHVSKDGSVELSQTQIIAINK
jgi:hypothetical protein